MKRAARLAPPEGAKPAPSPAPPRGKAGGGPLGEYLLKRETAQTVPPAGALSVHGEIPDTLQSKRLPGAAARAERLGHRLGTTFALHPTKVESPS